MHVLHTDKLIFTCWSKESTVVMEIKFDEDIWEKAWHEMTVVYDLKSQKRPLKFSAMTKELKEIIPEFSRLIPRQSTIDLGRNNPFIEHQNNDKPDLNVHVAEMHICLQKCLQFFQTAHNLTKTSASEVLVFMAGDLDRVSGSESSHSQPISYYLKGTSLRKDIYRKMLNKIWYTFVDRDIVVPVICSDGYFFDEFSRDGEGRPLSQLQLMKDIWKQMQKEGKTKLISYLRQCNKLENITENVNIRRETFKINDATIRTESGFSKF